MFIEEISAADDVTGVTVNVLKQCVFRAEHKKNNSEYSYHTNEEIGDFVAFDHCCTQINGSLSLPHPPPPDISRNLYY